MTRFFFKTLLTALLGTCTLSVTHLAYANSDLLTSTSRPHPAAQQQLMLDITRGGERLVAVGERGYIIYSDDHGNSWQQANVPTRVTLTSVTFANPSTGWAVGHDSIILVTKDGGLSWQKQLDGNQVNQQVLDAAQADYHALNTKINALPPTTRSEYATELDDLAFNLELAQEDFETGPFKPLLDVWFENEQRGYAIGSYGLMLTTLNGGKDWHLETSKLNNPNAAHLNNFTARGNHYYIAAETGLLFISNDQGNHWRTEQLPYDGSWFGSIVNEDGNITVYGLRGTIYHSTDQGYNWQPINNPTQKLLTAALPLGNGSTLLTGSDGTLLRLRNNIIQAIKQPHSWPLTGITKAANNTFWAVGFNGVHSIKIHQP